MEKIIKEYKAKIEAKNLKLQSIAVMIKASRNSGDDDMDLLLSARAIANAERQMLVQFLVDLECINTEN